MIGCECGIELDCKDLAGIEDFVLNRFYRAMENRSWMIEIRRHPMAEHFLVLIPYP